MYKEVVEELEEQKLRNPAGLERLLSWLQNQVLYVVVVHTLDSTDPSLS
jgi:hypothetical protein